MSADDSLVSMTCQAEQRFPELLGLSGEQRRSVVRRIRYAVIDGIKAGETDPVALRDAALKKLELRSDFGSLLSILGIAVLTALVEWVVKRMLDRWSRMGGALP